MANLQWTPVIISFLTGGAFGTILKIVYDLWQGRRQPVLARVEVDRVFSSFPCDSDLQANVSVIQGPLNCAFSNLSLAKVELSNAGNSDKESFEFGITLPKSDRTIHCECSGSDRHHNITPVEVPSLSNQYSTMDFRCTPFNRKDSYTLKLYVTSDLKAIKPCDVQLSSAAPVRITRSSGAEARSRMMQGMLVGVAVSGLTAAILSAITSFFITR
jgi:hypothetical protein